MLRKRIGFIGSGKVGCSFGRYISENGGEGLTVSGYYGRNRNTAREAALLAGGRAFDSPEELAAGSDLLLLTVPDSRISDVWASFAEKLKERGAPLYVGHCSGSQSAGAFQLKPSGCHFGSIHPLLAVYDTKTSHKRFSGAYFTIEGDEAFTEFAGELLASLNNPFRAIDADQKTLYHAASVLVSNLVCALAYEGVETFKACGLEGDFADNAWRSLFFENASNISVHGPVLALTGPVERGDAATVARHLAELTGDAREVYLLLSRTLTEAARRKNPDRDYSDIIELLENS